MRFVCKCVNMFICVGISKRVSMCERVCKCVNMSAYECVCACDSVCEYVCA